MYHMEHIQTPLCDIYSRKLQIFLQMSYLAGTKRTPVLNITYVIYVAFQPTLPALFCLHYAFVKSLT